jgi:hypothetical protein
MEAPSIHLRHVISHPLCQVLADSPIANRNGNTVTEVTIYWGFLNLGIFAAPYRERFGDLPSKTLLQSRQLRQRLN